MKIKLNAEKRLSMTNAMLTEENSIGRMATGASATLVGKALGTGLDFLRLAIMARLLGVEAFGLYAIAWNFLRIVGLLAPLGLQSGVIHFASRFWQKDDFQFRNIILRSLTLTLLMSTAMCLGLFWLAPWLSETVFHDPNLVVTLRIFVWMLPFMAGLRILSSSTRVSQRMSYSILAEDMTPAVANFILFFLLYWLTHEVIGAVFSTVLSFVLGFVVAAYFVRKMLPPSVKSPVKAKVTNRILLRYSLPTALTGLFGVLLTRTDRLFVGYYESTIDVGIYQAASQFAVVFAILLYGINLVLSPMIANLYHKHDFDEMNKLFQVNTKWGIYLSAPLFLTFFLVPTQIIEVVFGKPYMAGSMAMLILMIGQMVNVGTGAVGTILTMTAQQKSWFIISGVMLLVNFGLNVMLIPRFGFIGAAVANSLTISGLFIAGLLRVRFSLHLWPYDKRYRKGIVAGCLMAAAGFGFTRAVSLTPLWMILGTAVICASVFAVSLLLQGLDDEDYELLDLVRSRFG